MIVAGLSSIYLLTAAGLALFGVLGLITIWFYFQHRHESYPCPSVDEADLPHVTVQLPIYNERFVVERLISAAAELDYPRDRLQIQVIDDSTDSTSDMIKTIVCEYSAKGINIEHVRREHRSGFKAGALQEALSLAAGDYLAVFDADFQPKPEFLRQTIPHFHRQPELGLIQARWGHLNADASNLVAAQSIALDKHFALEQTVWHRANLYPKFNGSAGIWRRDCIEAVGGWHHDTVCEDLCLSMRANLAGWKFRFLRDIIAPAELPTTVSAFKNQQSRWAMGSTQCVLKFSGAILTDEKRPLMARIYSLIYMAGYSAQLLLLLLLLVQVPLIYFNYQPPGSVVLLGLLGIGQPALYFLGQSTLYESWWRRLFHFPTLLLLAIGIAPAVSRAILQAVFKTNHVFVRTPKGNYARLPNHRSDSAEAHSYRLSGDWIVLLELLIALYAAAGLVLSIWQQNYGSAFFMATSMIGLGYVGLSTLNELR